MTREHKIGRHLVRFEDDIVFTRQSGEMSMEELRQIIEIYTGFISRVPRCFALYDVTDGVPLGPAQRKLIKEWSQQHPFAGAAFFGASMIVRAITTLVMNATEMFRRGKSQPSLFCKTEQEARQWIDELRRTLASQPQQPQQPSA
jgi:hypothetical protein